MGRHAVFGSPPHFAFTHFSFFIHLNSVTPGIATGDGGGSASQS